MHCILICVMNTARCQIIYNCIDVSRHSSERINRLLSTFYGKYCFNFRTNQLSTRFFLRITHDIPGFTVFPTSKGGQIHHNPAAIWLTPTLNLDRQSASSIIKPTFTPSSTSCFLHILLGLPFFFWTSTSRSNTLLKKWPSSLLRTWPCHWTQFAMTNWSIVSFKPNINIKSIDIFLPSSCTPHIVLTMDLTMPRKIPISLSFKHHASLLCSIDGHA